MLRAPHPESLRIAGPAGTLEALLEGEAASHAWFGVICHPHPLHGGTLANKVVFTLARALHELDVPTLRFNFRGVGRSEGQFADGVGEADDALAVVAWGKARWPQATPWMLGFSFGAVVALGCAARAEAGLLVTVAPPIARAPSAPPIERAAGIERMVRESRVPRCPWLVVQGDADEVVDAAAVLEWASTRTPPPRLRVLHGAGHFLHGRLPELRAAVVQFARESGF
ncbi:MAG TPA: alpha/beta hydrolase [Steroidobacteraceae bacterium]|nr:alpha/beta hydrolase [Steroidobacteraceae bacterium]